MVGRDSCHFCESGMVGMSVCILGRGELAAPCKWEGCVEKKLPHVRGGGNEGMKGWLPQVSEVWKNGYPM